MILAVTPGDPHGIGPEIVWKALRKKSAPRGVSLLCIGAREPFEKLGAKIIEAEINGVEFREPPRSKSPYVWLLPAPKTAPKGRFLPGFQAGWAIERATGLIQAGQAQALVTGPISKERLQRGGFIYSGHTDFLADLCGVKQVTMMLANEQLRISLVTTHIALKDVSLKLTPEALRRAVLDTASHLHNWWGIQCPRIAVAALNPHAGEDGLFGREEIEVITPELKQLQKKNLGKFVLFGPLPADTLFAQHIATPRGKRYDAVVCMYHDQGLIPVKLLDFPKTVNVTLGLPIVRTSVDHGTGFDIAGKNKADPSSLISAIQMAAHIVKTSA